MSVWSLHDPEKMGSFRSCSLINGRTDAFLTYDSANEFASPSAVWRQSATSNQNFDGPNPYFPLWEVLKITGATLK